MPQLQRLLAAVAIWLLTAPTGRAATAVITPIVGPGGNAVSILADLSSDGSTVVGTISHSSGNEAFVWNRQTGAVALPHLTAIHTRNLGYGVSHDGAVIVGTTTIDVGTQIDAFTWTSAAGTTDVGGVTDGITTYAYGVSGDGSTIVGFRGAPYPNQVTTAYRWKAAGGFELLGHLPGGGSSSVAFGASFDGKAIVGASDSANGREAFLWREGMGLVGLGDFPGGEYSSGPSDLSHDGSVVVGTGIVAGTTRADHQHRAFRWTEQTGLVNLGLLPDGATALPRSVATGVTADGSIVVGEATSTRNQGAFLWTEARGMQSLWDILTTDYGLDLSDWQLTRAQGISADGTALVGIGVYQGQRQAWHVQLNPVPEPAAAILLAIAAWFPVRTRRAAPPACGIARILGAKLERPGAPLRHAPPPRAIRVAASQPRRTSCYTTWICAAASRNHAALSLGVRCCVLKHDPEAVAEARVPRHSTRFLDSRSHDGYGIAQGHN